MSEERWPGKWYELRAGKGCGMCANQGLEDSGWGVRLLVELARDLGAAG